MRTATHRRAAAMAAAAVVAVTISTVNGGNSATWAERNAEGNGAAGLGCRGTGDNDMQPYDDQGRTSANICAAFVARMNTIFCSDRFSCQNYGRDYGFLGCRETDGFAPPNTACARPVQTWLDMLGYEFSVLSHGGRTIDGDGLYLHGEGNYHQGHSVIQAGSNAQTCRQISAAINEVMREANGIPLCMTASPTASPSTPPTTLAPTGAPTPLPIVNTVADCGRFHVDCGGQLNATYQGAGITCPAPRGNPNGRCECSGSYHCRGTEQRGTCANQRDHCFERGITASPTAVPSAAPSAAPSADPSGSPSAVPTSSLPTAGPTPAPSAGPTAGPTTTYDRDLNGNIVWPTDATGVEVYVTDPYRRPIIPIDPYGNPVTIPPLTTTATTTATATDDDTSASAASSADGAALGAVVGVTVVLIVLVVLGALWYVHVNTIGAGAADRNPGFGNPAYDSTPGVWGASDQQSTGSADVAAGHGAAAASVSYMDVSPGPQQATGYMDVSASAAQDPDEEEDV